MNTFDFNEEQLDDMMHALGVNPRMKKLKMFRNRFSCNGPSESWDDLVSKGLAESKTEGSCVWYFVTDEGKSLISRLTGAKR